MPLAPFCALNSASFKSAPASCLEASFEAAKLNEKIKNREYTKSIEELEKKIEQYKKSETTGEKVPEVLEKELEETRLRLGLLDVYGQGITITLRDNESTIISANDILTLVNQLIISGAEAVSINGNRFMNNTEIVAVNSKDILINSKKIISPYRILAIGNKKNLESGITTKDRIYKPNACKW